MEIDPSAPESLIVSAFSSNLFESFIAVMFPCPTDTLNPVRGEVAKKLKELELIIIVLNILY
jgi:hypothetical protein